jgi:NADPH:quinone reductase
VLAVVTKDSVGSIPTIGDRPEPEPDSGELLVRVRAAGLNYADLVQVKDGYRAPVGSPVDILGTEMAGEVIRVGRHVSRFAAGDRVMAVMGGGAQAEFAVIHERLAMPMPVGLSWAEAGAFPESFMTAHDALFTQLGLTMSELVCVSGAAGGVGTAAVQLASAAGARVVATVRRSQHRAPVEALGPHIVAVDPVGFHSHGPFNAVLELVGGPNMAANIDSLAINGRISVIGVAAGRMAEINLAVLMSRRAQIYGSSLRPRPLEQKAEAARRVEAHILPILAAGQVRVPVDATFPLFDAPAAYKYFEQGGKFGKIVLLM